MKARKEILLCAGAIASPQILQRSGVGPEDVLNEFDISPVHVLPGVGQNLQDHLEMYLQYECKQPVSLYPALNGITNLKLVPSGYLKERVLARAINLKQGVLFAQVKSLLGQIFSFTFTSGD